MSTTQSVTATAVIISWPMANNPISLYNEASDDVYARRPNSSLTAFAGTAAVLDALSVLRIRPGQVWTTPGGWNGVEVACATGLSATLQIGGGEVSVSISPFYVHHLTKESADDGARSDLYTDDSHQLLVQPQPHLGLANTNVTTGWTILDDATGSVATSWNHVIGTSSLSFAKINGSNRKVGGVGNTIDSLDLRPFHKNGGFFLCNVYLPETGDYANADYFVLRLGTDLSNYNEWRIPYNDGDGFTPGNWAHIKVAMMLPSFAGNTGHGWNPAAVTYIALGIAFDNEDDEVAGIQVDHPAVIQGATVNADLSLASTVEAGVVRVKRLGLDVNDVLTTGAGATTSGSQRVTISTNDVNLAAINASLSSGLPTYGIDATGAAGYATVVTAPARVCHFVHVSVVANGAILSLDGGITDHFCIPANTERLFSGLTIPSGAVIQGKDIAGNYTNLAVSVW